MAHEISPASELPIRLKLATRFAGLRPAIDPSGHAVVFTHVPKTGGTTLDHILRIAVAVRGKHGRRLRFPKPATIPRQLRNQQLLELERISDEGLADSDYLSGHFPFGIHRRLPRPCLYLTLLRDPTARLLSNVRFGLDHRKWPRDASVDALIEQGRLIDNLQTRQIAGVANRDVPCTAATLATAIENLRAHYAVVGVTERFDETLKALITLFGWPDIAYTDRQVSSSPTDAALAEKVRATAERYFAFDMELYAYASSRPTPWSDGFLKGTAASNVRQDTVLLTSPLVSYGNRPAALLPATIFDSQVCPAVRQRGGEVLVV